MVKEAEASSMAKQKLMHVTPKYGRALQRQKHGADLIQIQSYNLSFRGRNMVDDHGTGGR